MTTVPGHILHVSELGCRYELVVNVRTQQSVLSPTNCGDIRLQNMKAWFAHGVTCTAFRVSSIGEEHDTSHTPTYQLEAVPKSMGRDSFTV